MYCLTLTHPSGVVQILGFGSRLSRALVMIALANQPVTLTPADPS